MRSRLEDLHRAAVVALRDAGGTGSVGLAVSGGLDSMVLLDVAVAVARETDGDLSGLHVLHFDHGLRPESGADAAFVLAQAERCGVGASSHKVDLAARHARRGGSVENLAREARYAWLATEAERLGLSALATAHHANDQAETVLHALARGATLLSLRGMPPTRPLVRGRALRLLRPFLDVERRTLESVARDANLEWREDPSNRDLRHRRNLLRHVVLPLLETDEGHARLRLRKLAQGVRRANARISRLARAIEPRLEFTMEPSDQGRVGSLALTYLQTLPPEVAFLALDRLVKRCDPRGELSPRVFVQVLTASGQDAQTLELARDLHVAIVPDSTRPRVRIRKSGDAAASVDDGWEPRPLPVPGRVRLPEIGREVESDIAEEAGATHSPYEQWIPAEVVEGALQVRRPATGERFEPFGLGGSKLVSDVLSEAKIAAGARWSIAVIADEGGILWVPGVRASERCRITHAGRGPFIRLTTRRLDDGED